MTRQISDHFFLHEFTTSQTAARMGRDIVPTAQEEANITRLCREVLEPIRSALRLPIVITSGLRPAWLNQAIGGSKTSAHMDGRAADVKVVGMSPAMFSRWIEANASRLNLPIDQVILEFDQWTHIGIADQPRQQYLTARSVNGAPVYTAGIA